ncbi:IAP [Plodia interpunctella granulovirus]|uniref:IAP n=1 Tax=Plodia interpunctella granulovirus TaxID=262175 RepID=A0A1L5JGR3_9BBAC|nr:IAP [Plodia interpunctella granulovirus]APO13965.1 IAP [Plodia interpunctella granulovirus]
MNSEENRLRSFQKWPGPPVLIPKLANAGFYAAPRNVNDDNVRCAYCNAELFMWRAHDDPLEDHKRDSPNCPFLVDPNAASIVPEGRDECGIYNTVLEESDESSDESSDECEMSNTPEVERSTERRNVLEISSPVQRNDDCGAWELDPGAREPDSLMIYNSNYATVASRIKSYELWPMSMPQSPQVMADAGFYYTGRGDKVICYHCGGGAFKWMHNDDPWEQHALWFPTCTYVKKMKGKKFIESVAKNHQGESILAKNHQGESMQVMKKNKIRSEFFPKVAGLLAACATAGKGEEAGNKPAASGESSREELHQEEAGKKEKSNENQKESDPEQESRPGESCPSHDSAGDPLCVVCYDQKRNICLVPCYHVSLCCQCALSLTDQKCPICCGTFTDVVKVYM